MWNKIVNPITGRKVAVNGTTGKKIIKYYLYLLRGGANPSTENTYFMDTPTCDNDADCLNPHNQCIKGKCMIVKCQGWPSKEKLVTVGAIKAIIDQIKNTSDKLFVVLKKGKSGKFIIQALTDNKPPTIDKKARMYDISDKLPPSYTQANQLPTQPNQKVRQPIQQVQHPREREQQVQTPTQPTRLPREVDVLDKDIRESHRYDYNTITVDGKPLKYLNAEKKKAIDTLSLPQNREVNDRLRREEDDKFGCSLATDCPLWGPANHTMCCGAEKKGIKGRCYVPKTKKPRSGCFIPEDDDNFILSKYRHKKPWKKVPNLKFIKKQLKLGPLSIPSVKQLKEYLHQNKFYLPDENQ